MSLSIIDIKDGAVLISDAHFSPSRLELLDFLKAIESKKIQIPQLILMGDIFDALFGGIRQSYILNQELIDLINEISLEVEVIYLEGNHDFNLKNVFKNTKVFTIQEQPVLSQIDGRKIYLAHGDFIGSSGYKIYTSLVRSKIFLFVLNLINIVLNNFILNKLQNYLLQKKDCTEIKDFENIIINRLDYNYDCEYFIEGHFHQNRFLKLNKFNYFNLGAFACNQRYFIVKSSHKELLVERKFSKG